MSAESTPDGEDTETRDSRRGYSSTIPKGDAPRLLSHPDAAWALVDADEPFFFADVDIDRSVFLRLVDAGLLSHADATQTERETDNGVASLAWRWETRDDLADWVRHHVDRPAARCPADGCSSSGVKNLGDGRYTCSRGACDSEFDRATAKEVLGR